MSLIKQVAFPDAKTQHMKTAAWRRVRVESKDAEGKITVSYHHRPLIIGTGENARILRWHEFLERVKDFIQNQNLAACRLLHAELLGEDYVGVATKLGVARSILAFYAGLVETVNTAEVLARFSEWVIGEGRWGLGCPHNCGRFIEFSTDGVGFRPSDPPAYTGKQAVVLDTLVIPAHVETDMDGKPTGPIIPESITYLVEHWDGHIAWMPEVPVNRGYLGYESGKYTCDKCGRPVELT